jgi:uncharacterized Zn finger protein
MCKHVAAVLYGIGARLDEKPDLLFRLHNVDEKELISSAGKGLPQAKAAPRGGKVLGGEDLSALFGLDMEEESGPRATKRAPSEPRGKGGVRMQGSGAKSKKKTGVSLQTRGSKKK